MKEHYHERRRLALATPDTARRRGRTSPRRADRTAMINRISDVLARGLVGLIWSLDAKYLSDTPSQPKHPLLG